MNRKAWEANYKSIWKSTLKQYIEGEGESFPYENCYPSFSLTREDLTGIVKSLFNRQSYSIIR